MKLCNSCDVEISELATSGLCKKCYKRDYRQRNKESQRESWRRWAARNPDKNLHYQLVKYNITIHEYNAMLEAQNYRCCICKRTPEEINDEKKRRLCVDHCHTTGVVRGLLCGHCNTAIGLLDHDPILIARALEYLATS